MGPLYAQVAMLATVVARGGEVKNVANVYNFRRTSSANPRVKANVDAIFQTNIATPVLAALNVDYTQVQNTVRWLDDATDMVAGFPHANVGGVAGERYDNFTAAYILLRTTSRKTRGSKHYGPIAEADINGDQIIAGSLPAFQAIADAILAGMTDADGNVWQSTVVNTKNAILGVNPTLFGDSLVSSVALRKTVGTMKRRKVRGVY